jgi:hypothetical protein
MVFCSICGESPGAEVKFRALSNSDRGRVLFPVHKAVGWLSLIVLALTGACSSGGERDLFQQVEGAASKAEAIDARSNEQAAINSRQEALSLMSRYLDEYAEEDHAGQVRSLKERFASQLRSLREGGSEYERIVRTELAEAAGSLPSSCAKVANQWKQYLERFPNSKFAEQARQAKSRWERRHQEEMERGFQVVFEEAEIAPVKGPSHGLLAGHTWDPEVFGASSAPDPYALLVINGDVRAYTPVVRDSFHPVWKKRSDVLQVSDEQQVSVVVRDRDVAEKALVLLMGTKLFSFGGIQAARAALKEDNDDDICRWTGTVRELMERGDNGLGHVQDCVKLRVRVVRPQ